MEPWYVSLACLHIKVLLLKSCGEFLVGGWWPNDPIPAPLVREEISKSFFCVLEVTMRVEDVVGRARVKGHNSILTQSRGKLEMKMEKWIKSTYTHNQNTIEDFENV